MCICVIHPVCSTGQIRSGYVIHDYIEMFLDLKPLGNKSISLATYEKPTAHIIFNEEKLRAFPQD